MCVDVDRILGKSWWPDVCHLSQGAHTPYTRGIPWVKSPERVRLTGGRAYWRERGHSYGSISSYRKLPPPACPGTTCTQCCEEFLPSRALWKVVVTRAKDTAHDYQEACLHESVDSHSLCGCGARRRRPRSSRNDYKSERDG